MINKVNNNEIQNNQLLQSNGVDKTGLFDKKNPYDKIDQNLLVDELNISKEAFKMFEKELDIKKFTKLALSDLDDNSHNVRVASKIVSGEIQLDESEIINDLFSNNKFLEDLLG